MTATYDFPAKPLLFLDVDGPFNPFKQFTKKGFIEPKVVGNNKRFEWAIYWTYPEGWETEGLRVILSPDHGRELVKLQELFTLVWATTWRHDANKWISPAVGLPELPVVDFINDGSERDWVRNQRHKGSWKTRHLADWLDTHGWATDANGERVRLPWAFVDDEVNRYDHSWLAYYWNEPSVQERVAPRKLVRIEPSRGMATSDFKELREFGQEHQL